MSKLGNAIRRRRQFRRDRRDLIVLWTVQALEPATGFGIMRVTDLPSGVVYVSLARLEAGGHVSSDWDAPQPHPDGRPRRRYYRVTDDGIRHAAELVDRLALRWQPAQGRQR